MLTIEGSHLVTQLPLLRVCTCHLEEGGPWVLSDWVMSVTVLPALGNRSSRRFYDYLCCWDPIPSSCTLSIWEVGDISSRLQILIQHPRLGSTAVLSLLSRLELAKYNKACSFDNRVCMSTYIHVDKHTHVHICAPYVTHVSKYILMHRYAFIGYALTDKSCEGNYE